MPYPYGYEGPPYLPQGSYNSLLLGGRMDYGGPIGGYGRSPLMYTHGGFLGSYPSPYSIGSSPYPTTKYLSSPVPLNDHGSQGLGRRLKGLTRLPSLRSNRLAVFHTENIDVTTPREAKPKEISRERQDSYGGTIRRGRTVIRMETQHLKDNPSLLHDFPLTKKPKKTAGQKLKEKYLVGSVKKRKHYGYRRPTLNDLRLQQEQEEQGDWRSSSRSPPIIDEEDPYYRTQKSSTSNQLMASEPFPMTQEDDESSVACDKEIELIFQPHGSIEATSQNIGASEVNDSPWTFSIEKSRNLDVELDEIQEEPQIVTLTLKPKSSLTKSKILELEEVNEIKNEMDTLNLNSDHDLRRLSSEFCFTLPLPTIQPPEETIDDDYSKTDNQHPWTHYRREPENPNDFCIKQNVMERCQSVKKPNLKLIIPFSQPLNSARAESSPGSLSPDTWGDRSPTFYARRSINTIIEKNENQEVDEEDSFDFWGLEKRPSYHCMRKDYPFSTNNNTPRDVTRLEHQQGDRKSQSPVEENGFDFWTQEKRPSYHRLQRIGNKNSNFTSWPSSSSSQPQLTSSSPIISTMNTTSQCGLFKDVIPTSSVGSSRVNFSSKKSTDSGFFESPPYLGSPKIKKKVDDSHSLQIIKKEKLENAIVTLKLKDTLASSIPPPPPPPTSLTINKSEVSQGAKAMTITERACKQPKLELPHDVTDLTIVLSKESMNPAKKMKHDPLTLTIQQRDTQLKLKPKTSKISIITEIKETKKFESTSISTDVILKDGQLHMKGLTSKVSITEVSTSQASTSEASTLEASTSETPTSEASIVEASTSETSTTEAFTLPNESSKIKSIEERSKVSSLSSNIRNPTIQRLKEAKRNSNSEGRNNNIISTVQSSNAYEDSPNVTPSSSVKVCNVSCHHKCEVFMPNLCGVNQKLLAEALCALKKEGSTSTSSSTLSAGTSSGSSRRMPSPSTDDESEDEVSKGKTESGGGNLAESRTCPSKGRPIYKSYHLNDFQFLKVLGKGSFGKVLLAELKGTDSYFAIKCLKKDVVLEDDDVECTMIERKVLLIGSKHPYLCHLLCTFQSESHLFFAMEYLNGGDLMFHIQHDGRFSEERARFYGAEIVSGLKFLHKKGVIYRDLKLDNILLDYEGHVRIADFGMCKLQIFLDRTADTFCGTPDYMSPEIIKGIRYNQCVDWWAFGVLLYEMLVGQSPFSGTDEDELFWSICNEPVHFPRFLSRESKRILELLLEKDGYRRLGSPGSIYGDIKDTTFFVSIDWDRLERRELEPPFKPKLRDPLDVKYFDTTFTKEVARLTPVDKQILRSMDQSQFDGFSYTNPDTTD